MEGYDAGGSCGRAVVSFLGGWTRELHTYGYVSGVYTSAASGVKDLVAAYKSSGSSRPDDIWAADWNGKPVLTDSFLPGTYWSNHQRLHQYAGAHDEKWGGATLDIDSDAADGKVAGQASVAELLRSRRERHAVRADRGAGPHGQGDADPAQPVRVVDRCAVARGRAQGHVGHTRLRDGRSDGQGRLLGHGDPDAGHVPGSGAIRRADHGQLRLPYRSRGVRPADRGALRRVTPTHSPIVLYAADKYDMATAAQVRRSLALPATNVTGTFKQAWKDAAGGKDLVIAVGEPAADALYFNVCGWTDPAGWPAGSTPFYYPGYPVRSSIGRNYFELASTPTTAKTTQLLTELTQYALTGSLPGSGPTAIAATPPALHCEGSAKVPVP